MKSGIDIKGHVVSSSVHFIGKDTEAERLNDLFKFILPLNGRLKSRTQFSNLHSSILSSIPYASS